MEEFNSYYDYSRRNTYPSATHSVATVPANNDSWWGSLAKFTVKKLKEFGGSVVDSVTGVVREPNDQHTQHRTFLGTQTRYQISNAGSNSDLQLASRGDSGGNPSALLEEIDRTIDLLQNKKRKLETTLSSDNGALASKRLTTSSAFPSRPGPCLPSVTASSSFLGAHSASSSFAGRGSLVLPSPRPNPFQYPWRDATQRSAIAAAKERLLHTARCSPYSTASPRVKKTPNRPPPAKLIPLPPLSPAFFFAKAQPIAPDNGNSSVVDNTSYTTKEEIQPEIPKETAQQPQEFVAKPIEKPEMISNAVDLSTRNDKQPPLDKPATVNNSPLNAARQPPRDNPHATATPPKTETAPVARESPQKPKPSEEIKNPFKTNVNAFNPEGIDPSQFLWAGTTEKPPQTLEKSPKLPEIIEKSPKTSQSVKQPETAAKSASTPQSVEKLPEIREKSPKIAKAPEVVKSNAKPVVETETIELDDSVIIDESGPTVTLPSFGDNRRGPSAAHSGFGPAYRSAWEVLHNPGPGVVEMPPQEWVSDDLDAEGDEWVDEGDAFGVEKDDDEDDDEIICEGFLAKDSVDAPQLARGRFRLEVEENGDGESGEDYGEEGEDEEEEGDEDEMEEEEGDDEEGEDEYDDNDDGEEDVNEEEDDEEEVDSAVEVSADDGDSQFSSGDDPDDEA
ncbi:glutamic acid-rich protein-like [Paramacrobiotus metropolitanus]|uniref:glutamic acid-rich protein-like n=1 Tax=Paramacrobiotus metropolitanus TaxID=2943436 RepID=UPI002445DBD3|nr:glutamic acid-rich protein-like [Paramacrobiotus metropolitanus]